MEMLDSLSDEEIRQKLAQFGHPVGPVTETTRKILIKKLKNLISNQRKNPSKCSSGDDSEIDDVNSSKLWSNSRRRAMPPPVSTTRSRRSNRSLNLTDSDLETKRKNDSMFNGSILSTTSRSSHQISPVLFDSGSDSEYTDNSTISPRSNSYRGLSSYRSQLSPGKRTSPLPKTYTSPHNTSKLFNKKESRPFLSSLRRLTRLDSLDIKETDIDDSSSFNYYRRPLLNYRENTSIRPIYERVPDVEPPKWKSWLLSYLPIGLLVVFLLFVAWLGITYAIRVSRQPSRLSAVVTPSTKPSTNVYPICGNSDREITSGRCIPQDKLRFAVALYKDVHQTLLARGVQSKCGPALSDGSYITAYMTEREVVQFLLKMRPLDAVQIEDGVRYLALLLISNPSWGVAVIREPPNDLCPILDNLLLVPSELAAGMSFLFVTPCPNLPMSCRVMLWFYNAVYYIVLSCIVPGIVFLIYLAIKYYLVQIRAEEETVLQLVEQILKKLYEMYRPNQDFVPIRHVHDLLIPPAARPKMAVVWEKAVAFLDKHESRVRREIQTVWGEETEVWRVLTNHAATNTPTTPLSTPLVSPTINTNQATERLYPDLSGHMQRESTRVWQGEAFETSEGSMNSLPVSPTPCLKIRHMFQPNSLYGPDSETAVKDAIIEKCEGVRIIHVTVDKLSKDGCVYLKCATSQEAGIAYRRLHGSWFDGSLVTVKYLRLERYHERFPDAVYLKSPLQPSNNLKLSLGGLNTFNVQNEH